MIDFETWVRLNERPIFSMPVMGNTYGIFGLDYGDIKPLFYANGQMIKNTDRPEYAAAGVIRVENNAILHRFDEINRRMWQFSDLGGIIRGNLHGGTDAPDGWLNMPVIPHIPGPESDHGDQDKIVFDDKSMLYRGVYCVSGASVMIHAWDGVFQLPLARHQIQSRHAELELFLMDNPKLSLRGFNYLTQYVNQMRHLEYSAGQRQTPLDRYESQLRALSRLFYGGMAR